MSLDRMQSRQGVLVLNPEPSYTVNSSLSSVASNQLPGGVLIGAIGGTLGATAASIGGGALLVKPQYGFSPAGISSYSTSGGTGAQISHDNNAVIIVSLSAGGLHALQPPQYHGQCMTVLNVAGSGSFATGFTTTAQGTGSTTTAAIPTLLVATTVAASAGRAFIGLTNLGGTASNSTTALWHCVG